MHLIYLVFGPNTSNHIQAYFSILTFLRQPTALIGITVVTDQPDFYARLGEKIHIFYVSPELLREWEGPHHFFWRLKIKALEHVATMHPDHALVYLDTDTFLGGSADELNQALLANTPFMHEPEGRLAALPSKTERLTWKQLQGRKWGDITLTSNTVMWNAGVVGIPARYLTETVGLALRLCDEWCAAGVTRRLIEQVALSVALSEIGSLKMASTSIGHYWSAKPEWNQSIAAFLLDSFLQARSLEAELISLADFNFGAQPIQQRVKNTRGRLERLAQRLFPNQQQIFWQ